MEEEIKTKVCSRCHEEKLLTEFWKNKNRKDGLQCWCKNCMLEHKHITHPEVKPRKKIKQSDNPHTKVCSNCGIEKPLSEFHKNKSRDKGVDYFCKDCRNEYNRKHYSLHKKEESDRSKKYYSTHKEEIKVKNHFNYINNKDEIDYRNKEYEKTENGKITRRNISIKFRLKHPEKVIEYRRKYSSTHKENHNMYARWYRTTPNGKIIDARHRQTRRLKNKNLKNDLALRGWNEILKMQNNCCAGVGCGKEFNDDLPPTKDHIIPLTNPWCTGLTKGNVQALCFSCNSSKGNRFSIARAIDEVLVDKWEN